MMSSELGATFYVVAAIAALLIGLSKGGLSTVGALGTPILALVIPPTRAAAVLLPLLLVSDLVGFWSYRRDYDWRNLKILIPAGIVGVALGWGTASLVSDRWVACAIGVIGCGFCLNNWRLRNVVITARPADVPRGALWGTIMGFSSFVSHTGGPPYQVYVLPQQLPKIVYAGTTTIVFAAINLVKVLPYWALGQFSSNNLQVSAVLVPIAVVGTFAGVRLVRVLPQKLYFNFVQVMLFLVSIKLIYDAFF